MPIDTSGPVELTDDTAFRASPIQSEGTLIHDAWSIDLSGIRDRTVESKYRDVRRDALYGPYTEMFVRVLSDERIPLKDVAEQLLHLERMWVDTRKSEISQEEAEQVMKEYDVDYKKIISDTQEATVEEVAALNLPEEIERQIVATVKTINVTYFWGKGENSGSGASARKGRRNILIDVCDVVDTARDIRNITRIDLSKRMIESILASHVAHELGHFVDAAPFYEKGDAPAERASDLVQRRSVGFPVQTKGDSNFQKAINHESFAEYWGQAVAQRMSLSPEVSEDIRRVEVSRWLNIIERARLHRLSEMYFFLEKSYLESKSRMEEGMFSGVSTVYVQFLLRSLEDVTSGHEVGAAFPFERREVVEVLLGAASFKKSALLKLR